jgi:hypothetical protein
MMYEWLKHRTCVCKQGQCWFGLLNSNCEFNKTCTLSASTAAWDMQDARVALLDVSPLRPYLNDYLCHLNTGEALQATGVYR